MRGGGTFRTHSGKMVLNFYTLPSYKGRRKDNWEISKAQFLYTPPRMRRDDTISASILKANFYTLPSYEGRPTHKVFKKSVYFYTLPSYKGRRAANLNSVAFNRFLYTPLV